MEQVNNPGRWKSGQSGNPSGRPIGTGEVAKLRAAIAKHVPKIVRKQVELALAGDTTAARLLLERVIPPLKAETLPSPLELPQEATLADSGREALKAAAAGVLSAEQAAQLVALLNGLATLVSADELAARVAALEKSSGLR